VNVGDSCSGASVSPAREFTVDSRVGKLLRFEYRESYVRTLGGLLIFDLEEPFAAGGTTLAPVNNSNFRIDPGTTSSIVTTSFDLGCFVFAANSFPFGTGSKTSPPNIASSVCSSSRTSCVIVLNCVSE
jgi:hypothetical protein